METATEKWKSPDCSDQFLNCEVGKDESDPRSKGVVSSRSQDLLYSKPPCTTIVPCALKNYQKYAEEPPVSIKTELDIENAVVKHESNVPRKQLQQNIMTDTHLPIEWENNMETEEPIIKVELETSPTVLQTRSKPRSHLPSADVHQTPPPASRFCTTSDDDATLASPYPVYLQRALQTGAEDDCPEISSDGMGLSDSSLIFDMDHPSHNFHEGTPKVSIDAQATKNTFKCAHCRYETKSKLRLTNHMRKHKGVRPYECDLCEYKATRPSNLYAHRRTHTNERAYKCELCVYSASRRDRLQIHMRMHTGEKPYKCDQCAYSTSQPANLQRHVRTHTGVKPYECTLCEYAASQLDTLKNHMHTHRKDKPYQCDRCDYRTSRRIALEEHGHTHTGKKPYKCKQCEYRSSSLGTLRRHKLTHTDEKPYKCHMCEYSAYDGSNLRRHVRTHSNQKPYKCEQCDYRASRAYYIKIHTQSHHA